ncbi:putative tail tubular protein B [uncultured Mediterranean phage uvMED]|nr:putative tail tubular protein B [uncultured Mediterranean phage uvMED]
MPRTTLALTSFVSGEFGNKLTGRTDFDKYQSAAKTMENFLVHPQGAATRRVGTQFIASVKTASAKTRLIPFEFSTTQTYILEFGNNYIRFFKDKGQILSGGSAYEISTPYLTAELFDIKFAQSADVMYLVHPNHEAMKLSRTGHTSWTLAAVDFTDGPYLATNSTTTTLTPASAGVGTGVNITASAVTGINAGSGFQTTDVGRFISFNSGIAKITARTNTTVVVCTILTAFANTDAKDDWKLGAFSDTTGHPSCVSFYEQRLVFAGTKDEPQTIFFSKAGDYENMTSGTNADDAMVYTIAANQVNVIRYLKAQRTLVIGTTAAEYTVSADGTDASITPTNITIKRQSSYGSANVDAVTAGNAILFLQKAKRKIRELAYNFDSDSYVAPDLTILNDSVTDSGIIQMEWQQEPNNNLWCVRDDGQLACLTYQRSENVVSWSRHIIGGAFGSGNAVVESIASISGELNEDELWVIVKRTVNGGTVRYVECFSDFDFDETEATDFKFLDSHLSYSGGATTSLSGLSHLEGQSVSILADGSVHANKTVSSGAITLDRSVTKACVGLSYDSVLQTMRIEGGAAEGTSQGKIKRISKVVLRLFETVGVKVGPSLTNLETIPFRTTSSNLSAPVDTLIEGDKEIEFNDDYNSDGHIFIKQDQPLPASILAIYPTLVTNDG